MGKLSFSPLANGSRVSVGSSSESSEEQFMCLARSCRTGDEARDERKSRKSAHHLNQRLARSRLSRKKTNDLSLEASNEDIEEIHDILKPLELSCEEGAPDSLPRFQWVPLSPSAPSVDNPGPLSFSTAAMVEASKSPQASPSSEKHAMLPGRPLTNNLAHHAWNKVRGLKLILRHKIASRAASKPNATPGAHSSITASEKSKSSAGPPSRKASISSTVDEFRSGGRRKDAHQRSELKRIHQMGRDQRLELKRMHHNLLSSAQHAFEDEIWHACGVEAGHLFAKQKFATLISGGLFSKLHDTEDIEEEVTEDGATAEDPYSPQSQDMNMKAMMSSGAQLSPSGVRPPSSPRFTSSTVQSQDTS